MEISKDETLRLEAEFDTFDTCEGSELVDSNKSRLMIRPKSFEFDCMLKHCRPEDIIYECDTNDDIELGLLESRGKKCNLASMYTTIN